MRALILARNFPNNVMELLGLWVERLVRSSRSFCQPIVIAPVPYCPPLPGLPESFSRFRRVQRHRVSGGVPIHHPRFLAGPGYSLYNHEAQLYYAGAIKLIDRLWRESPFDLIHAHFTYPDGVVATRLGRRYGIPVVITEHVPWDVWEAYPNVRQQVIQALRDCQRHISVSRSALSSVERCAGKTNNTLIIPNGVDASIFKLPERGAATRVRNQILFVGAVRPVKGVDILLRAMRILADRHIEANLLIAGEPFYGGYRKEEVRLRQLTIQLNLGGRVQFLGRRTPSEVAALMGESALLVLPSRLESFGSVLVEALACGTPVVATQCGGPEDIVTEEVGALVAPENPVALADGIARVIERQSDYASAALRQYALRNFGMETVGARLARVYQDAVDQFRNPSTGSSHAIYDIVGR